MCIRDSDGSVYLVKDSVDWVQEKIQESIALSQINDDDFTFHQHFFVAKYGAEKMLASGSIVNDEYSEYERTDTAKISLHWNNERPQSEFHDTVFTMIMQDGEVKYSTEGALVGYTEEGQQIKRVSIDEVVLHEEAQNVEISSLVDDAGSNLVISNTSKYANALETSFTMKYYTKTFFGWKKRLERDLSPEEWSKSEGAYHVDLASLGMKKKFTKKGRKVKVKLAMKRSLGDDVLLVEHSEKLKLGFAKEDKKKDKKKDK